MPSLLDPLLAAEAVFSVGDLNSHLNRCKKLLTSIEVRSFEMRGS